MASYADVQTWLKGEIAQLVAYPVERMEGQGRLKDDFGLDSSDLLFVQLQIEQRLGHVLSRPSDTELDIHTLDDLTALVLASDAAHAS